MKNDKMFAFAKSQSVIELNLSKDVCPFRMKRFRLYVDHKPSAVIEPISENETATFITYTFLSNDFMFVPGHYYEVATGQNFFVPIDISFLVTTKEFEEKYRFDGQLGAIYAKDKTTFRVFSPFSNEVTLHVRKMGSQDWEIYSMKHDFDNGVFEVSVPGDYDGASYLYERLMFGQAKIVADPYSFSLSSNGRWSFVIDPAKIRCLPTYEECLPPFEDRMQAIIYECDVRDMTSLSSLPDRGTYAALSRQGLKNEEGNPVGLDYLASLGVTHIQLLPVLDFQSIDEDDPFSMYNWGYDPVSYFAPEGSYCSDPNDPYARVKELKTLVSSLHRKGMRVVFDVVYNHVFSNLYNPLNILCPNYFYRIDADGRLSNGTGCGNDLESRNHMTRKLIVDSLLHCLDFYDVDGFRFDLMGILDITTIRQGYKELSKIKSNILYYGEGWDLRTALPSDKKASYVNAFQMPFASFFNDRFRDVTKGKSSESEAHVKGYLLGDTDYRDGFKHVLLGSCVPLAFGPMFASPSQSVNYVECHDNHTLYDKITIACEDEDEKQKVKRVKLNLFATLLAAGIPFFHQGEEICGTKGGIGNSYNAPDKINGFDYGLLEKNKELYRFFREAIAFKKEHLYFTSKEFDKMMQSEKITFENLEHGALKINYEMKDETLFVILNPSRETIMYDFPNYVNLIFNETGKISKDDDFFIHMAIVNALSISVFCQKDAERKEGKQS